MSISATIPRIGIRHHNLMPEQPVGDNRAASQVLICKKCGQRFAAISGQVGRRCLCGGILEKLDKSIEEKPKCPP
jgi:hypothetical protein